MIRRHYRFSGRVQGVGFRYRAQYTAQHLGLTGWVENNWDGTVEMEVQGPEAAVDKVVTTLTATSRWIMIEDIQSYDMPPQPGEHSFRVRG